MKWTQGLVVSSFKPDKKLMKLGRAPVVVSDGASISSTVLAQPPKLSIYRVALEESHFVTSAGSLNEPDLGPAVDYVAISEIDAVTSGSMAGNPEAALAKILASVSEEDSVLPEANPRAAGIAIGVYKGTPPADETTISSGVSGVSLVLT